ncbi:MAG: lysophospholipid acyltransferase family protein [Candidatus Omnitrophica bacterium]|nr:lysophospholipid acyltransferase family protein [Candidatus Omnitrophota bacterium]MDE2222666.1 lysophospholipid acyltransferase family protein [Candidatus Omnitrophota bacterium]
MGNYYLYRMGLFLAGIFPLKVSRVLVRVLCDFHFCFSTTDRRAVENNLKVISGRDEVPAAQVRAVFRNFGQYLLEFFISSRCLKPDFIQSNVRVQNLEHLNEVLQRGKGGILVSAHLGSWELGGTVLPMMGFPLSVVALAHKDPRVNALFNRRRESFGAMVIQTDVAVRRIADHLQQNRLIAILADRDFGNRGMHMDFLGRQTMVPKGAAFFSLKMGVPIVPIFFIRSANDQYEIKVYPPIEPPALNGPAKVTEDMIRECIRKYLTVIEQEILKNPSQWLIFREFWQPCA